MTRHPFCRASSTSRVVGGLGITSATIMSEVTESIASGMRASTSGKRPIEVALTRISVPSGTGSRRARARR